MLPTVTATATDAPLVADGFLARAHGRQAAATTTRTNLGPLTTPWTPPPSCQSVYAPCDTCSVIFAAQACGPDVDGYLADEQSCWPPTGTAVPVPATRGALAGWGVYSPGIVCPVGFTSVVASTYGANNFGFQFPLTAGETAVGCCPIFETLQGGAFSASLDPNGHQTCKLAVTTGVVELIKCTIGGTPETHPVPWSFRSFTMSQYDIYAPLIQIVWKSSDIPKGVLPPNVPASTTSASINGAATQSALPAPLGNTVNQSRLSDGALAGIIIGTILALLAIGLGIFWCLRRRNRQQKHTLIPKPPHGDAEEYGSDLAIAINGFWTDGGAYGPPEFAHRGYHVAGSEKTLVGRATAPPENLQPGAGLSYSDDRQGREYEMTASDPFYDPHLEANMKFAGMPPGIWGGREDSPGPARVPAGRGS